MCEVPCLTSSSICYWCTVLPIQQPAWNKWEFQHAEQLYMVVFACSLTQFPICWASFMAPRPVKAIQILLQKSTVLIWQYCSLSAMHEATPASVSWSYVNITFILWLQFLVAWSEMSVWTVCHRSTLAVCLAVSLFFLTFKNWSRFMPNLRWSLIHTSTPMGAFLFPFFLNFLFEHLQWAWRSTQFVSTSVYQSMYSRQQTERENFLA